jgi:sulfate adenylyltransferase (ADP) / ATP adenylyltransferase
MQFWAHVQRTTQRAKAAGAVCPVTTSEHVLSDQGLNFLVRLVASLSEKDRARRQSASLTGLPVNPFLPYDRNLWLGDLGPQHVLLLNKYPVVADHVLIVTRRFATQQTVLELADLAAVAQCLHAVGTRPGLAFYNGGTEAGSSQPHRHLQLVPLPLSEQIAGAVPLEAALLTGVPDAGPGRGELPFRHAVARWNLDDDVSRSSATLYDLYRGLLDELQLAPAADERVQACRPYNLLITQGWVLVVPRACECFEGIPLNALAFAGALLVRHESQLERLQQAGPLAALRAVVAN